MVYWFIKAFSGFEYNFPQDNTMQLFSIISPDSVRPNAFCPTWGVHVYSLTFNFLRKKYSVYNVVII